MILDHCVPLKIPVVIDTRDFWPDIFGEQLPGPFRPLAPLVFYPFRRAASRTLARADALSGMTESAMDWALAMAGRARRHTDFWFPFSYRKPDHHGARSTHSGLRLCFLGTLSPRSNLETIIEAVRIARNRNINVSIDICGRGEVEPALHQRASGLDAVRFAGWLDAEALASVMASSDLGVLPYDRPDFHLSIPNKFVEYLAGDLPVLSCTDGEVRTLIEQTGCGVWSRPTPEAMADAIAAIQPADLERMRKEAAGTFATTFEENAVFSKALACLQNIVQTRSSGSAA